MAKAKYTAGPDGVFRTRIWDGTYNSDGKKHRAHLSSKKSSADLEKQVNQLRKKVESGEVVQPKDIVFLDYARDWLKTYKSVRENNTKAMYKNVIEKHLTVLDGLKLQDIRKIHFQMVINNAQNKPRTCQQISVTFKQIIKSAVQDKYLAPQAYYDICNDIDLPKYKPAEKRPLYPQEIAAIKKANFTPREKTFLYIIYGCGLRRGEVLALNKHLDIDLKNRLLKVRQSVEFDGNNPSFKVPKSENGFRSVPIPPYLMSHLKEYIPNLDSDYLIPSRDGLVLTKSGYDKMWMQIVKKMNVAAGGTNELKVIYGFTAHTFRHNYCTNLCYQIPKISIRKIAQLMGDTEAVVLKIYNHIKDEKEDAAGVVNDAMAL